MKKYKVVYETQDTEMTHEYRTLTQAKHAILNYAKNFASTYAEFPTQIREAWQRFYESDGYVFFAQPDAGITLFVHMEIEPM